MIIIAWIALILNALIMLKILPKVFTDKTTTDRVANFIACLWIMLNCILYIYILRLEYE